jgi:hypothetical protein
MKYSRRNKIQSIGALANASVLPLSVDGKPSDHHQPGHDPANLDEIINLFNFEKIAQNHMLHIAYEFLDIGAADGVFKKMNIPRKEFEYAMRCRERPLFQISMLRHLESLRQFTDQSKTWRIR